MTLRTTLQIAWRNLGRNRKRTVLALATIAVAQLMLVIFQGLLVGYSEWIVRVATGPMVGHVQVHAPGWRDERTLDLYLADPEPMVRSIQQVPGVASVSQRVYVPVLVAAREEGRAAVVLGLEPEAESGPDGLLAGSAALPKKGAALVGKELATVLGLRAGDQIAVVGQAADGSIASELFDVAALASTPVELINLMGIVIRLEDARELIALPQGAHELVVRANRGVDAVALAQEISGRPALAGAEVLPWQTLVPEIGAVLDFVGVYEWVLAAIFFLAAAVSVANTLLMSTFERTRELGVLLALGGRPGSIVAMVVAEALVLGVVGLVAGSVLGTALVAWGTRYGWDLTALIGGQSELSFMGMRWSMTVFPRIELEHLANGALAVLLTTILACLWPATRAARLEPVEAMRA